jgi:hypothetical protein
MLKKLEPLAPCQWLARARGIGNASLGFNAQARSWQIVFVRGGAGSIPVGITALYPNGHKGAIMLNHKIAIYVPSTDKDNKPLSAYKRRKELTHARVLMAGWFGGYTSYEAQGGWMNDGNLMEEKVTIVQSFANDETFSKVSNVIALARSMAAFLNQAALALEVDGVMTYYQPLLKVA